MQTTSKPPVVLGNRWEVTWTSKGTGKRQRRFFAAEQQAKAFQVSLAKRGMVSQLCEHTLTCFPVRWYARGEGFSVSRRSA